MVATAMNYRIQLGQFIDDRYLIRSVISMGGYGVVWEAWHELLQIPLAIKMIDVSNMDAATIERMKRECQIGGQLTDLNRVVRVLDALHAGPYLLIVMDLMEGGDLAARIRGRPVYFRQALDWALDLCDTLEQVHGLGIIHRDIKPQNILLDSHDHIRLCDFGIAHVNRSRLTVDSQPGTPAYKAPELDRGFSASASSDVYSLCAVLFELWSSRQYADYKALDKTLVYKDFLECLAKEYPNIPEICQSIVADAILGGLAPLEERSELSKLQNTLREAQLHLADPEENKQQAISISLTSIPRYIPRPNIVSVTGSILPEGHTAAADWLIEEIEYAFQEEIWNGSRHTLFFWYDPSGAWSAIVPMLEGRIPLLLDRGSLLEMRYELEQRDDQELTVLYLRRSPGQITYLTPYEFVARILTLEPYDVLRRHGTPLPSTGQARQAIQSLIPQLLAASLGQDESFWQSISSYEDARAKLLGDVQERLFRFLAAPTEATWSDVCQQGREQLFADEMQQRYGYSNPDTDPEVFAKGLVASWCLVDIFESYGRPSSFPFRSVLPRPAVWSNCRNALRGFRNDRRFHAAVIQITREIERQYQGLIDWAQHQERTLYDAPFYKIALIALKRVIEQISAYQERQELMLFLQNSLPEFKNASQGFWGQQGLIPQWQALSKGAEIISAAEEACKYCSQIYQPNDFIQAYTNHWWKIDAEYRSYHALPESDISMAALTTWVEQMYRLYLEQVNRSWTTTLTKAHMWPPSQTLEPQWKLWSSIGKGKERHAVFFIDALRYDIAQRVADELDKKGAVTTIREARLSGLPSITPLGMASLLPQAEAQKVIWESDWKITVPKSKGNLADKAAREAFLKQSLRGAISLSLEDLLQPQRKLPLEASWLLVFSQDIDALGENVSSLAFDTLESIVQRIIQGIRKALDAGFSSIHVVTDHGFLLLNPFLEKDKITPPAIELLKLGQRYLIGQDLPEYSNLLRFPVRGSDTLYAYYPPGIAAFTTPGRYYYSHGGPTLHETVIPYLIIRSIQKQRRVNVKLTLPEFIYSPIFRIELHPEGENMFDLEREVRIAIELPDGTRLREVEELVSVTGSVVKNLRLTPSDRIRRGDIISVVVRDAQTAEELHRKTATVQIDLEL